MDLECVLKIMPIVTPILVFILGVRFVKSIESAKNQVERQSHFAKKWADEFFDTSDEFMKGVERVLALFTSIQGFANPNDERGTRYQQECSDLFPTIAELGLRIRRMVPFAPKNGGTVKEKASAILETLSNMVRERRGNMDEIIRLIAEFNDAVKLAHSEILDNKK